jgi:hypothetical protein
MSLVPLGKILFSCMAKKSVADGGGVEGYTHTSILCLKPVRVSKMENVVAEDNRNGVREHCCVAYVVGVSRR